MTLEQFLEISDTLHFDMEWKKLIKAKKRHLNNPLVHEDQKDRIRRELNAYIGDMHENDRDIEKLLNRYLPAGYMTQIRLFINNRPGAFRS